MLIRSRVGLGIPADIHPTHYYLFLLETKFSLSILIETSKKTDRSRTTSFFFCKMNPWKLLSWLILVESALSVSVECNFTDFKSLYTCESEGLETDDQDSFITEVIGLHLNETTNKDVQQLYVSKSPSLEYFPGGLSSFFPNLESIRVKDSGLKYIFKSDLAGLSKLKFFSAVKNQIETIGPQLFQDSTLLEEIHLESNKISSISEDLLDSNEGKLTIVHLSGNECIKKDLESPVFSPTDVKKMIIELCPLSQQELIENGDKQVEKLTNQLAILQLKIDDGKKSLMPENSTSDVDLKANDKLIAQVNKLMFEKRNLEANITFSLQSLDQNTADIQNLTDQNQDFKSINEKLEANLTESLDLLNATQTKKQELDSLVSNLTQQLAAEKIITQNFPSIILMIANNASDLRTSKVNLENKLSSTIQEKDDEISTLRSDLQKALAEKEKSEKSVKTQILLLKSVNIELNKKMTINDANKAYYENLEARYKKFKDQKKDS